MGLLSASYDGSIDFESLPTDWADRIARRVETGLLVPGSRRRANYGIRSKSADAVSFSADDMWTAIAIGLNDVELRRADDKHVVYHGSFGRWAAYGAALGLAVTGAALIAVLFLPGGTAQVDVYGSWGWPLLIFLLAFFGLVWPRVLVVIHRRVAARALERIVREAVAA